MLRRRRYMAVCLKLTAMFSNSIEVAKLPQRLLADAVLGSDLFSLK